MATVKRAKVTPEIALAEELAGWREVPGFSIRRLGSELLGVNLVCEDPEEFGDSSKFYQWSSETIPVGDFWGWISTDNLRDKDGVWLLRIPEVRDSNGVATFIYEPEWVGVRLPGAWDGRLIGRLKPVRRLDRAEEFETPFAVLGQAKTLDKETVFWMVGTSGVEAPDWPKLEQGHRAEFRGYEMKMVGVMRSPILAEDDWALRNGQDHRFEQEGLFEMAWADKAGNFLGWEPIRSLQEARQINPVLVRHCRPFPEWEQLESQLRVSSGGREL